MSETEKGAPLAYLSTYQYFKLCSGKAPIQNWGKKRIIIQYLPTSRTNRRLAFVSCLPCPVQQRNCRYTLAGSEEGPSTGVGGFICTPLEAYRSAMQTDERARGCCTVLFKSNGAWFVGSRLSWGGSCVSTADSLAMRRRGTHASVKLCFVR